jgi:hypothetical protein
MSAIGKVAKIAMGAGLLAVAVYVILAFPGFMSDSDSVVPLHAMRETAQ